MQKSSKNQDSNPQDSNQPKSLEKAKTVFDHIKHIREAKTANYFTSLSETDQKTFNKYVILMGLSMDQNAIDGISYVSKYLDILPANAFYKVCCDVTPKSNRFCKWIKSSNPKYSKKLIGIIASYYKISKSEAYDYCSTFFKNESQLENLINLCSNMGYNESEIEKMLEGKDE